MVQDVTSNQVLNLARNNRDSKYVHKHESEELINLIINSFRLKPIQKFIMLLHLAAYTKDVAHLLDSLLSISMMYLSNLHQVIVNGTTQGCRLFELLEAAETSDEIQELNIELSALQNCFRV